MKRRVFHMLGLVGLAGLMLVGSAKAEKKDVALLKEGTPIEFVGQVTSEPKINEQKFQVAIGPERVDYTAHISKARMWDVKGERIDEDGIQDKDWVHGFGWIMDDPRRIRVNTLTVVADEKTGISKTAFVSGGRTSGWLAASGVVIETTKLLEGQPVILVAEVTSQPNDLKQEKKMQVKMGADTKGYTLHLKDAVIRDVNGKIMDTNDLVDKMWVRGEGYITNEPRRIQITRLVVLGPNSEDYLAGPFFYSGYERGYLFQVDGDRVRPGKK
jgi:hypothetical protein